MTRVLLLVCLVALVSPETAGSRNEPPRHLQVKAKVCGFKLFRTETLGRDTRVHPRVYVGGRPIDGSRNGPGYMEWSGRGVAISLKVLRREGPAEWRVASVRPSCSFVRLVLTLGG